jgi:hypothetical protein
MSEAENLVAGDFGLLQQMMNKYGALHANGGPVPLDYWEAWQGKKPVNPDGTIQGSTGKVNPATGMVDYELKNDDGFFGEFVNMAKIPLTFAAMAAGAGGITNWLNAGGFGGLGGAGGAMDMGAGGVREAMGLGSGSGAGGLGLAEAPWGVNPSGGGMDYSDFLSEFGFPSDAGGSLYNGPMSLSGSGIFNDPFKLGGLESLVKGGGGLLSQLAGKLDAGTLTKLLPSLLGVLGSNSQNNALQDLAGLQGANRDQLLGFGAPYLERLAGLYNDPSSFLNSQEVQVPVQQGTDAMARALSVGGNPIGNGTMLQELQNYSANQLFGKLGQEKDRLAGFGGLTAYNQAGAQAFGNTSAQQAVAQGEGNMWNSLGYGLNQVFNPQPTLADLLKEFKGFSPSNSLPA